MKNDSSVSPVLVDLSSDPALCLAPSFHSRAWINVYVGPVGVLYSLKHLFLGS